ncbi:hypothetical protein SWPG_00170 [Synechococcus phage S-CBM2]|nr:hypothetical protein SWPG_00170 [Synechococcus phage S-CBM2]
MNRQELQDTYINEIIDNMSIKEMSALLFDLMDNELDKYTDRELLEEIDSISPHLLEE